MLHTPTLSENRSSPAEAARRALVVIPCLNEEAHIGGLLEQLLRDGGLVDPLIVVADGGSGDRSREIVDRIAQAHPQVRLLDNPKRLQSAGLNLAAHRFGEGRFWLIRIDAHATYPENYASDLIAQAEQRDVASVVVAMDTVGEAGVQRAAAAAQSSRLGAGGSAHRRAGVSGWVDHGHHALFRMRDFLACGGYDESFSHNEDAEFDLRLTQQGGKIWLTDQPRVAYHPRSTLRALWRQYLAYGDGRARTVLKHRARLRPRQALPLLVAPAVLLALAAPLFWPLILPAAAWAGICLAYGLVLGLKRKDAWAALSGPAAMTMHLAWSLGAWRRFLRERPKPRGAALARPAVP